MDNKASQRNRRLAGAAGVAGSLLFFLGDMLLYGHPGPGGNFLGGMLASVRSASQARLFAGGLVGPPAACLCIAGFWHVSLNIRDSASVLARIVFASFFAMMIFGGAIHTLWAANALALKYCHGGAAECRAVLHGVGSYLSLAFMVASVPGIAGALLLAALVLLGKTWYPRWTALANPAALMLLSPLAERTPAPFGAVLVGGFVSLALACFFLVSLLTTWSRPDGR